MNIKCLTLCLVTTFQEKDFPQYSRFLLQAIEGGVTSVQLREKSLSIDIIRQLALKLKSILTPLNIPLIINDYVELAKEIDADGVHLGQSDISPVEARELLGPNKIIGLSIETTEQLFAANRLTCIDYVAASAIFPSKTKLNCKTIWGVEGLKQIVKKSTHPVIAIGGIDASNVKIIIENGAAGVAVVSAIHDSSDPRKTANELICEINQVKQ